MMVILAFLVCCTTIDANADPSISPHAQTSSSARGYYPPSASRPARISASQYWALSAGGMLSENNQEPMDRVITGDPVTAQDIAKQKQRMSQSWQVSDRASLLQTLSWLEKEGHRAAWDELARYQSSGGLALNSVAAKYKLDPNEMNDKVVLVRKYSPSFGRKSILAWDYGRYINVCRWGVTCGYLSESEAWRYMMPIARTIQRTFSSWNDFGLNYIVGRQFWDNTSDPETLQMYQWLCSSPESPWKKAAWNTDLSR